MIIYACYRLMNTMPTRSAELMKGLDHVENTIVEAHISHELEHHSNSRSLYLQH